MIKPLILVTNDDGITAQGIITLKTIAAQIGDVVVVAPDKPQSGMGHAITIHSTLRVTAFNSSSGLTEYACSGTPVDCVKLAVSKLLPRKPDLVISGINHGSNSSINVIYSGTMSAAVEGAIEGIPSIGFSLSNYASDANFEVCEKWVKKIINHVLLHSMDKGVCLNVNFPDVPAESIKGIKVARQAKAYWVEKFDERTDPSNKTYYWLTGYLHNPDEGSDTDEYALANNFVSVVPIQFDLTAYNSINKLKQLEGNE